jgi:hypothetical protein
VRTGSHMRRCSYVRVRSYIRGGVVDQGGARAERLCEGVHGHERARTLPPLGHPLRGGHRGTLVFSHHQHRDSFASLSLSRSLSFQTIPEDLDEPQLIPEAFILDMSASKLDNRGLAKAISAAPSTLLSHLEICRRRDLVHDLLTTATAVCYYNRPVPAHSHGRVGRQAGDLPDGARHQDRGAPLEALRPHRG